LSVSLLNWLLVGFIVRALVQMLRRGVQLSTAVVLLQASPLNPGLILFMFLCTACVFVWTRLAILCCTLRRVSFLNHFRCSSLR